MRVLLIPLVALLLMACGVSQTDTDNTVIEDVPDAEGPTDTSGLTACLTESEWLFSGQSNFERTEHFGWFPTELQVMRSQDAFWADILEVPQFPIVPGLFGLEMDQKGLATRLISTAKGGTSITCWLRDGDCYNERIVPVLGQSINGIAWWQGEAETADCSGEDVSLYYDRLTQLIAEYREDFGTVPFIIIELPVGYFGDCGDLEEDFRDSIRDAQETATEEIESVYLVSTTDITFGSTHPRYAYWKIAERLARQAALLVCPSEL